MITPRQLQALRLVDCGTGMRLLDAANVLVSAQARKLQSMGLIRQAPEKWIAYEPTAEGHRVLRESEKITLVF